MCLVERREADEPVDAALCLEDAVGVLALDGEGGGLQPCLLARARLDQLGLEAAIGRPTQVHAEQDLGPILRVGAARPGMDGDDRVATVVLAREERVFLKPFELVAERGDRGGDFVGHLPVHGEELARILVIARQALVAVEPLGQAGVVGRNPRRALLFVPESRCAELVLEPGDASPQLLRVKGNHGPRRAGSRSPRAAAPAVVASARSPGRW